MECELRGVDVRLFRVNVRHQELYLRLLGVTVNHQGLNLGFSLVNELSWEDYTLTGGILAHQGMKIGYLT